MKSQSEAPFWKARKPDGLRRDAIKSLASRSKTVIVFVHGISGDCDATWGNLPELIECETGFQCYYLSFHFPSKLLERADVRRAAKDLAALLRTQYAECDDIHFITHSTGGLVVKEILALDYDPKSPNRVAGDDVGLPRPVLPRVRQVLNICVPHLGGTPWVSWPAGTAYACLLLPGMLVVGQVCRLFGWGAGANLIILQLMYKNPWVTAQDRRFSEMISELEKLGLSSPLSNDFAASDDGVVKFRGRRIESLPGTHSSGKLPTEASDVIVKLLGARLRQFCDPSVEFDRNFADVTHYFICDFEKSQSIVELLDQVTAQELRALATVRFARVGSQGEVLEKLRTALGLASGQLEGVFLVVTGAAQVGKSAVLRRMTKQLSIHFQNDPASPLPIFINLGRISVDSAALPNAPTVVRGAVLWERISQAWLEYAQSLLGARFPGATFPKTWLTQRLTNHSQLVIIFDGLDEFLSRHPLINIDDFRSMFVTPCLRPQKGRACIVGVRATQTGLRDLASDPQHVLEVRRLSEDEASAFDGGAEAIQMVAEELRPFVMTPMIVSRIGKLAAEGRTPMLQTRAGLFELMLSYKLQTPAEGSSGDSPEQTLDALTLVAWAMDSALQGEISENQIDQAIDEIAQRWIAHKAASSESQFTLRILRAVTYLKKKENRDALLQRTILYRPTGVSVAKWRFEHPTWVEFLVARYYSLCIRAGHFTELGFRGLTHGINQIVADELDDLIITESLLDSIWKFNSLPTGGLIVGSMVALLDNLYSQIDVKAFSFLEARLAEIPLELGRHLATVGLGYRILRPSSRRDFAVENLRRYLPPLLSSVCHAPPSPGNTLLAGSAWCLLKLIKNRHWIGSGPPPGLNWTEITMRPEFDEDALRLATGGYPGQPGIEYKLVQRGMLSAVKGIELDASLTMTLPYLYALVHAYKVGSLETGLHSELREILEKGSKAEESVILYAAKDAPEYVEWFSRCQLLM